MPGALSGGVGAHPGDDERPSSTAELRAGAMMPLVVGPKTSRRMARIRVTAVWLDGDVLCASLHGHQDAESLGQLAELMRRILERRRATAVLLDASEAPSVAVDAGPPLAAVVEIAAKVNGGAVHLVVGPPAVRAAVLSACWSVRARLAAGQTREEALGSLTGARSRRA